MTLFFPLDTFPITYGLYSLEKYFFILSRFLDFIIKQNPTPQLNVLSISLVEIPLFLSHLNIFKVLILFKSILASRLFGITLLILSDNPPPVIFAHPFNKLLLIKLVTSLT